RGSGTVANTSDVTTPSVPPPVPRSAQNKSGSPSSSQTTTRPPARPTSAARRLPHLRPHVRPRTPRPPPRVSPATPTDGPQPAGGDRDAVHRRHVDDDAAGGRPPGETVPATAYRQRQPRPARERDGLNDVGGAGTPHHGRRPDAAVVGDGRDPGDVVVGVARAQHLAVDTGGEGRPRHGHRSRHRSIMACGSDNTGLVTPAAPVSPSPCRAHDGRGRRKRSRTRASRAAA